jgi:acyl carrier protein
VREGDVTADVSGKLRRFIDEQVLDGDTSRAVSDDTDLYGGILDSIALMQLVTYLEEEFGVVVTDDEMVPANFRDVTSIEALIARRTSTVDVGRDV